MVPKCLHTLSVYNTVFWYIRKYSTYTRTPPRVVYLPVYTLKYTPRSLVYPNVLLYTTLILVYYSNMPSLVYPHDYTPCPMSIPLANFFSGLSP